jgi:hypothetical protein
VTRFARFLYAVPVAIALWTPRSQAAEADRCPGADQPIATDRPDTANSSLVVPVGSLQSENGVDVSSQRGERALTGPNSRLRLGVAPCLEVFLDVPSYMAALRGDAPSGFGDVAPGLKWQISPAPGDFDLSATFGMALPTGSQAIAGPGVQPYLQFPWSKKLTEDWSLSGMLTVFDRPADPVGKVTTETSFVIGRDFGESFELFTEYVGDFPDAGPSRQLINSGALWRVSKTQQLDMHVAFGLNGTSPNLIVGVGYSFRLDGLFDKPR